jgi:hypothetical protein
LSLINLFNIPPLEAYGTHNFIYLDPSEVQVSHVSDFCGQRGRISSSPAVHALRDSPALREEVFETRQRKRGWSLRSRIAGKRSVMSYRDGGVFLPFSNLMLECSSGGLTLLADQFCSSGGSASSPTNSNNVRIKNKSVSGGQRGRCPSRFPI